MKQVLTNESKWPLQPLDKDDRIKDVEEALVFGNHKGAVNQQDLLVKLVTNDVIRGQNHSDPGSPPHSSQHPSAKYHQ
jgi:hypothetical protein